MRTGEGLFVTFLIFPTNITRNNDEATILVFLFSCSFSSRSWGKTLTPMSTSEEVRYEVNFAGTQTFAVTLRSRLKEIFIPDDPFRHLQDLPPRTKAHRIIKYFVPILEWGPRYTFNEFRYDLLAGITVASLAIPQGISYARLAEIPPIIGLCESQSISSSILISDPKYSKSINC